jgi:cobalt-zinc-cadmium efflux system outer membrane protein
MRTLAARAVVAAVLLPGIARAQTVSLSEAQALARLSSESPRVQAMRASIDVARADVIAAGRWPNPRVTFNRETVAGVAEHMFLVAQPIPVSGRRRLEVEAASLRVEATTRRAEDQIRRLRADLRLAYTALWVAQTRERELARSRDRLRELAVVLARREAAGEAAGFDHLRAEHEVIEVEADRGAAISDRARAQGALVSFFADASQGVVIEAVTAERPRAPLPSVDDLVAQAEKRGVLIALQHDRQAAELAGRSAARRVVPDPEIVAGTKSSTFAGGDVGSVLSVHVTVPLFDRARPERAAAEARAAQVRADADAVRLTLRAQIAAWRAALVERRAAADRYRAAVTASVGEIERIAQVSYEAGEQGILEVLDAHRTASASRVRQAALDAAVREAEIELEFVSGWEMP